jgi:hypothetical protein
MNGQRSMDTEHQNILGKTVTLTKAKTVGLDWDVVIWKPAALQVAEGIKEGKITGKIIEYRKVGLTETVKVRLDPVYANWFTYADLSFTLGDVIIHDAIDDILEDINFDL